MQAVLRIVDCHHYGWRWFRRCTQTWRKDFISRSLVGNLDVAPNIYIYCLWEMWRTFTFIPNFQQQKHGIYDLNILLLSIRIYIYIRTFIFKDIHIHICKHRATIWSAFLVKDIKTPSEKTKLSECIRKTAATQVTECGRDCAGRYYVKVGNFPWGSDHSGVNMSEL